jgi:hypothetical protein
MKIEYPYDYQTRKLIRERVVVMKDCIIVQRECSLMLRREMLVKQWVTAASEGKQILRKRVQDCISIVDYELNLLHDIMKQRELKALSGDSSEEVLYKKIRAMLDNSEQQNP